MGIVICAVLAAMLLGSFVRDIVQVLRDRAVFASGTVAVSSMIRGKLDHHPASSRPAIEYKYKVDVAFTDQQGRRHVGTAEISRLSRVEDFEQWTVRYDPSDPTRFALSGAAEGAAPWGVPIEVLVLGCAIAAAGFFAWRLARRYRRRIRACAQDGHEVLLEYSKTFRRRSRYFVEYALDGRTRWAVLDRPPRYVDIDGVRYVVAVVSASAPDEPVAVGEDLSPFSAEPSSMKASA